MSGRTAIGQIVKQKASGGFSLCFSRAGFTLIELMIVVSIIGILAAIAVPNYQWGVIKAKESVLREDLYNFRTTIDQFHADQGKYPDSISELKDRKYLREIPKDPFTKSAETWITVAPPPETSSTPSGSVSLSSISSGSSSSTPQGSVYDVHSGSNLIGTNGTPYNEW
jgi:general secretion pathway protein G